MSCFCSLEILPAPPSNVTVSGGGSIPQVKTQQPQMKSVNAAVPCWRICAEVLAHVVAVSWQLWHGPLCTPDGQAPGCGVITRQSYGSEQMKSAVSSGVIINVSLAVLTVVSWVYHY